MTDDELITECAMKVKPELWGRKSCGPYKGVNVLYIEYMRRRAELINEPDDADATDTPARYKTQDANGEWWWHDTMPYIIEEHAVWDSDGWQMLAARGKVPAGHDWRTTLREAEPMTTTPNAPRWPAHLAHKPEFNPSSSSLTDSQAQQFAVESGACSDGIPCGELRVYGCRNCDDCPNRLEPTHQEMINRCNATLAFWPTDVEAASQIIPVDSPWQWLEDDGEVVLISNGTPAIITESDWCAGEDLSEPQCLHYGGKCGENGYCAPCPNRPQPEYDPESVAFKQPRYQDARGEDWINEFARTATMDEFRGAMRFTVGKYNRRIGKKDDELQEVRKMRDYCERWEQYLLARR